MPRKLSACLFFAAAFMLAGAHARGDNAVPQKEKIANVATLYYWQWKDHPGLAMLVAQRARAENATDRVAGEKLDSGLGGLPHYDQWASYPELAPLAVQGTRTVVGASAH